MGVVDYNENKSTGERPATKIHDWWVGRKNCDCMVDVPEEGVIVVSYEKCSTHIHVFTGAFHIYGCN